MNIKNLILQILSNLLKILRHEWKAVTIIFIASVLQAFAVNYFTIHYRISGIAVLTNYVFGISPGWVIAFGNLILIIWGRKDLSVRFIILTSIAFVTFSSMLTVFAKYPLPLPDDKFMATVITGLIKGFAGGMMFNVGGSGGGTDIIASVLRRRYDLEVGRLSIFINLFILAFSIGIIGLEAVVYGAVGLYVNGVIVDSMTRSFDKRKQAIIITNIPDEVSSFIYKLGHGVTKLEGRGGYTGQPREVLITLLEPRQVVALKHFLKEKDDRAFVSICDASEVLGQGFKSWRSL